MGRLTTRQDASQRLSCGTGWRRCQTFWQSRATIDTGCIYLILGEIFCCSEMRPPEDGLLEVGPLEVGPPEVGPLEVGLPEISVLEVGPLEVGLPEVSLLEVGSQEVGLLEVGLLEVSLLEVGIDEVGLLEVGEVRRHIAHIYSCQPCLGKLRTEEI